MKFPQHKCALYLTHNDHKNDYHTAKQWIEEKEDFDKDYFDWTSPTAREKCIETNEVWELQVYDLTPVGFYKFSGPTLEEVMTAANGE